MSLKRVRYDEIIGEIKKCNLEFGMCVEEISTKMESSNGFHPDLYIAEYNYGENIIDSESFVTPSDSDIRIRERLLSSISNEKKIPLIFILKNSSEIYVENQPGIIKSLKLLSAGELIGTYESTEFMQQRVNKFKSSNSAPSWQALAGSRSIFLPALFRSREVQDRLVNALEKNNIFSLSESKEYGFPSNGNFRDKLKKDVFPIVKAISNISDLKCDWKTKIIVFSDEWMSNDLDVFSSFRKYIYDAAWDQASFSINLDAISSQLSSKVRFFSITDAKILLDLAQICLGKTFAHEVLQLDDPQRTGPFLTVQKFLQESLEYKNCPLFIHPVNIHAKMQTSEKVISYYSTTFAGQIFSEELNTTAIDLTKSFFKPMGRIISQPEFLKYLSNLCGYRVSLSCYGRKRKGVESLDNRDMFNDVINQIEVGQNIDYDHPYLRACIKAEFTKQS
jgi:hypothetical protein